MKRIDKKICVSMIALILTALLMPLLKAHASTNTHFEQLLSPAITPELNVMVTRLEDGKLTCGEPTAEEAAMAVDRPVDLKLDPIQGLSDQEATSETTGLKINLRATSQLEAFPQAKQAFLKAAATWEALIQNPITITIDVDFGETCFGKPFPNNTKGLTGFQNTGDSSWYPTVREKLIAGASSPEERSLYNLLPAAAAPTDLGNAMGVFGPATLFRALGLLSPISDPEGEKPTLGDPPFIGFSSDTVYDFDQSDGIDSDKQDFIALAEHEIGHVLGFFSMVGVREQLPNSPLGVSVWDLFRFRPGVTVSTFASAPRILSSGGVQIFFSGNSEALVATGRIDSSGGDGFQSHHWKPRELAGKYIGVMDPTLPPGAFSPITDNDLNALERMGYRIARGQSVPVINSLSASLDGDVLTLTGTASDVDGDIQRAQVKLLNGGGFVEAQTENFPVNLGTTPQVTYNLAITNLSQFPLAIEALLTFTDSQGHTSARATSRFNASVPGGPDLDSVELIGKKLKMKGSGLEGQIQVEINGVVVDEFDNGSDRKLTLKGSRTGLNLRTGFNRIRIRNGAIFSNIFIVSVS